MTGISIINQSTVVADSDVAAAIPGLQAQVTDDLFPAWGSGADLTFRADKTAPDSDWQVVILDDSDAAGILGFHDLTASGQPLGKVFAKTDQQYNCDWHVTLSHELLEAIVDPMLSRMATSSDGERYYAVEVGDAVEDDQFAYVKAGVKVSNFVFPAWYGLPGGSKLDFMGTVQLPFQIMPGGYAAYLDAQSGQWLQAALGIGAATHRNGEPSYANKSRFQKRLRPRNTWKLSTR